MRLLTSVSAIAALAGATAVALTSALADRPHPVASHVPAQPVAQPSYEAATPGRVYRVAKAPRTVRLFPRRRYEAVSRGPFTPYLLPRFDRGLAGPIYGPGVFPGYGPGYGLGYGFGRDRGDVNVDTNVDVGVRQNAPVVVVPDGASRRADVADARTEASLRAIERRLQGLEQRPDLEWLGIAANAQGEHSDRIRALVADIIAERETERRERRSGARVAAVDPVLADLAAERDALRDLEGRGRNPHILYLGFDE